MAVSFEEAIQDPGKKFLEPERILEENGLTREEKIAILRRWEYDARELSVAEEENMTGGPPHRLGAILRTLRKLDENYDKVSSAPTKQGGG